MSESIFKHSLSTAGIMIGFTVLGTALLAYTFSTTREPIAKSEAEARMALFRQILPETLHDNDLLKDVVKIAPGGDLGNRDETLAYRARLNGQPSAVVLEAVAPDGYSGDIKLLIAVRGDGEIIGVRTLAHKETPGLGDYIDIGHGDWIKKNFDGQSLAKTPDAGWKVKKDNGRFDYMAGATITPRAVVKAVHKALQYFAAHRDELFAATKGDAK
ncbi:MAG: electron transporter RnfG [Methylophilales bacterium RIFCSPHIGHO2_02_FULL_57_10]|nr:MAG: electron transporter RnfG [Methylophilales bacterium RIFCSPHIGHO2_02_FULL_57_10]